MALGPVSSPTDKNLPKGSWSAVSAPLAAGTRHHKRSSSNNMDSSQGPGGQESVIGVTGLSGPVPLEARGDPGRDVPAPSPRSASAVSALLILGSGASLGPSRKDTGDHIQGPALGRSVQDLNSIRPAKCLWPGMVTFPRTRTWLPLGHHSASSLPRLHGPTPEPGQSPSRRHQAGPAHTLGPPVEPVGSPGPVAWSPALLRSPSLWPLRASRTHWACPPAASG